MERYQRQVILPELGAEGQQKLLSAKVLVIGAGGLGCPVLQYLVAAGVGTIGIVDDDTVSLSNLHRQVLYDMSDLGQPKAGRAAGKLQQMNPDATVIPYVRRLTNQNAVDLFEAYDLVVDATDNFPARYLINDACVFSGKPLVYGAVSKFEGQVAVFNYQSSAGDRAVNYRDLFPLPPKEGEVANCAEAGVIGVLPGIIGSLQAGEAIKLITGIGQPLANRLLTFNLLTNEWYAWEITPNPQSVPLLPKDKDAFLNAVYEETCATGDFTEIGSSEFNGLLSEQGVTVIDVREMGEQPVIEEFAHLRIPLSQLPDRLASLKGDTFIAVCQSGKRSRQAAQWLSGAFRSKRVHSLQGGIIGWKQQIQSKAHE